MSQKTNLLTVDQALSYLLEQARPAAGIETVATERALGRVLAEPQVSTVNVPPLDNSAMDGYAVSLADLAGSLQPRLRVAQRIPAGRTGQPLSPGTAARIFTGAPIPAGCDAVVMQENCAADGDMVTINTPPGSGRISAAPGRISRSAWKSCPPGSSSAPRKWDSPPRWGWRACRCSASCGSPPFSPATRS